LSVSARQIPSCVHLKSETVLARITQHAREFEIAVGGSVVVVVVFITVTCTANGGHWVPPGGLQAYILPQPWLCRVPKVRRGGEGDTCVSMETCNIKIHNREHRFPNSVPISGP